MVVLGAGGWFQLKKDPAVALKAAGLSQAATLRPWRNALEQPLIPATVQARLDSKGLLLAEQSHLPIPTPEGPMHHGGLRVRLTHQPGTVAPWLRARSTATRCYTLAVDPAGSLVRLGLWDEAAKSARELRTFPVPQELPAGQEYELELTWWAARWRRG